VNRWWTTKTSSLQCAPTRAFSSEVDTGSHQEIASKQKARARF
jgi:hypothetical protein